MADGIAPKIIVTPSQPRVKRFRVADLFCGAGGTSTGILRAARAILAEQGLGPNEADRQVDLIAVNHWPTAIDTHRRNHPLHAARTHCADLESARPRDLVPEGVLDLLCASPTCTYHSRARGGKPVNDQQRMDPWHVVRWCTELRVHRLLVENVPEFIDWGPCDLRTGRPIKRRKGEYFRAWCDALRAVGFRRLEYRVLNCADYGDATTRQRFFLIACSDGKPLRWPEPTFSAAGASDLLGKRQPWRPAAEIIDWSHEGKSIFARKKPLAPNTVRRILAGARRYSWPQPYIDALDALLEGREPLLDIKFEDLTEYVSNRASEGRTAPIHAGSIVLSTASGGVAREVNKPIPTVTTGGNGARPQLIEPLVVPLSNSSSAGVPRGSDRPLRTITTAKGGEMALAKPLLAPYYGGGSGLTSQPTSDPVPAITTKARFGLAEPVLMRASHGDSDGRDPAGRLVGLEKPLPALTAGGGDMSLAEPFLVAHYGEREGQRPRTHAASEPLPTVTTANRFGIAEPFVLPVTHHGDSRVHGIDEPLRTITGAHRGELGIAAPSAAGYRIDILYRMLHWRELARASSFDDEGEVYDFAGTGTEITKQIGNAVPGRTAKALGMALLRGRA